VLLFFGLVASNCENLYGPYVTIMATVTRAGGRFRSELTRGVFTGVLAVLCGIVGSAVSDDFVTNLINFITFLLYLLVPWTAINLVDFYVIRKGHYDVEAILSVDGVYGRFNWRSLGVYAVAAAAEVPFMNSAVYEGPIATALGGVDIAWIVGLLVAGALYPRPQPHGEHGPRGSGRRRTAHRHRGRARLIAAPPHRRRKRQP